MQNLRFNHYFQNHQLRDFQYKSNHDCFCSYYHCGILIKINFAFDICFKVVDKEYYENGCFNNGESFDKANTFKT